MGSFFFKAEVFFSMSLRLVFLRSLVYSAIGTIAYALDYQFGAEMYRLFLSWHTHVLIMAVVTILAGAALALTKRARHTFSGVVEKSLSLAGRVAAGSAGGLMGIALTAWVMAVLFGSNIPFWIATLAVLIFCMIALAPWLCIAIIGGIVERRAIVANNTRRFAIMPLIGISLMGVGWWLLHEWVVLVMA